MITDTVQDKTKRPVLTTKKDVQPSQGWINQLGDHVVSTEALDSMQSDGKQLSPAETQTLGPTTNEAWSSWLQPKAQPSQIEYQPQPIQVEKPAPTIHEIKQDLHNAEVKTVLMAADIMAAMQKDNKVNEAGWPARGEMPFNTESENTQEVFEEEIQAPPPQSPAENYLFERSEPVQEFKQEINIDRPLKAVDFGFFFSWMFGGLGEIVGKVTRAIGSQVRPFLAANKDLIPKEILFGSKPKLTPEQQTAEIKQNQHKSSFFEALKMNARMFLGLDRKRSLKQQVELTNQQAGVSNVSYEGIMDQTGQIRDNIAVAAEQGGSQKTAEQAKNDKQRSLMFSAKGKAKTGPGISFSSDKSHNFNNAAKLSG